MNASPSLQNEKELAQVAKQVYVRNVELNIRNRTLLTLNEMYDVINRTVGQRETARALSEVIVRSLGVQLCAIFLFNPRGKKLHILSHEVANAAHENITLDAHLLFNGLVIAAGRNTSATSSVIYSLKRRVFHSLIDALSLATRESHAARLQENLQLKSVIVDPLIFGHKALGVLVLGIGRSMDELARAERESIKGITDVVAIALEQAKTYSDLKKANKQLKELDNLKDEFVSIASHELRTPMTAIKSYLWMAINRPPQPVGAELMKYLQISYNSTERLIRLVNDMLTVSRIERKKIELKNDKCDLTEVVQALYDELKVTATEKQIDFVFEHEPQTGFFVYGDKDKLREVIQNLVGNALKFTPPGGKVHIILNRRENRYIAIAVKDTGSGIPKEEMSKLFQKFSKIDYSYAHHSSQPGTGLGLYISKQIATLHRGTIEVESTVGTGSQFTLVLPVYTSGGGE